MSISFARVAGSSTTYAATNAYTAASQPTATGVAGGPGTLTGQDVSDYYLLTVFTKPYLDAHTLSYPSWRYSYIFWFVLAGLYVLWVAFHRLHIRGGALGASLRKLGMRKLGSSRQTAAVKPASASAGKQPKPVRSWSSPTLAQLFGIALMLAFTFCICYIGPDFINPTDCMFGGGKCPFHPVNGDNATNQYSRMRKIKRAAEYVISAAMGEPNHKFEKRRQARYAWSPLTDPLLAGPNFTIDKGWWQSGNRVGLIAYAFMPLAVSLALKQWPMNLLATPFLTNYHIDRTAFWHRWVGRLIWVLSTVHGGLWTKQLMIDINPFNEPTWNSSWRWHRLLAGGIGYIMLTVLVLFSFKPLRTRFYELFYYSHVALSLGFLVTMVIHYQALQGWGLLAAGLWGFERITRLCVFLWLNYGAGIPVFGEGRAGKAQYMSRNADGGGFKVHHVEKRLSAEGQKYAAGGAQGSAGAYPYYGNEEWSAASRSTANLQESVTSPEKRAPAAGVYDYGAGNEAAREQHLPYGAGPYNPPRPQFPGESRSTSHAGTLSRPSHRSQAIPKGYALAQVLPGRVLKLTLHTQRHLNWKAGQHVQLTIPSVRWWQSHPYTISNAQDFTESLLAGKPDGEERGGSEVVLLMSTRRGFTRRLYSSILEKRKRIVRSGGGGQDAVYSSDKDASLSGASTPGGVLVRAQTYLPTGSAARAQWEDHSTVVLVAAGMGVTYVMSVLEHLCLQMAAKDAALRGEQPSWAEPSWAEQRKSSRSKKPTNVSRIRFVWILREYAHLAWIAPALRRCLDISDPSRLRIDLFVTRELAQMHNVHPFSSESPSTPLTSSALMPAAKTADDLFAPPNPRFASHGGGHRRTGSADSSMSDLSQTVVDTSDYGSYAASAGAGGALHKHTSPAPSSHMQQPAQRHRQMASGADEGEIADYSVTDMILFEGEEEEPPTAADEVISKSVKKEGKLRRALSRKKKGMSSESAQHLTASSPQPSNRGARPSNLYSEDEGDDGHMYPPPAGRFAADSRRGSAHSYTHHLDEPTSGSATPTPYGRRGSTPGLPLLHDAEALGSLDMSATDKEDLDIIAELARGGKPDLPAILDAEIERSQGSVAVGCCGPKTLNDHVRALVAKRISPSRIAKGDTRGNVELIAEEFSF